MRVRRDGEREDGVEEVAEDERGDCVMVLSRESVRLIYDACPLCAPSGRPRKP